MTRFVIIFFKMYCKHKKNNYNKSVGFTYNIKLFLMSYISTAIYTNCKTALVVMAVATKVN